MTRTAWLLVLALLAPVTASAEEDAAGLAPLRAAAERGDPEAQVELGILYEYGFSLPDHKAQALAWYMIAAAHGSAKAVARRDALKGGMSGAEIEEANRRYAELAATVQKPEAPKPSEPAVAEPAPQ